MADGSELFLRLIASVLAPMLAATLTCESIPYGVLRRHSGSMRGYVAGGQPASGLPPNQLPPTAREPVLSPIACVLAPMLATELALESFHYEVLRPPPVWHACYRP